MNQGLPSTHTHRVVAQVLSVAIAAIIVLMIMLSLLWNTPSGSPLAGDDFGHGGPLPTPVGALSGDDFGHNG